MWPERYSEPGVGMRTIGSILCGVNSFGRRHPELRALFRPAWQRCTRLSWALRSKVFSQRPIAFDAGKHTFAMVAKGQIAELIWRGGFEMDERNFAAGEIKPGMRVLNIGANTGLYTIIASKMAGPDGMVHAFEPASKTFGLLKQNIELNGCNHVVANNLALSNFQGQLSLNRDPLHPNFDGHFFVSRLAEVSAGSPAPMEIVSCITLDEYWRDVCGGNIKPVDFIVIDVEGAELLVFEGALRTIEASPNLVMLMECTVHIEETQTLLSKFGFSYYQLETDSHRPSPVELGRGSFVAVRGMRRIF
jgi:FkbM family methyltransferase